MAKATQAFEDKPFQDMKKKLDGIYARAEKEAQEKLEKYMKRFDAQNTEKEALVAAGKMTDEAYNKWRTGKLMGAKSCKELVAQMSENLLNTNKTALAYVNNLLPEAYRAGYNEIGSEPLKGISFNLVDRSTVRILARTNSSFLPYIYVNGKRDVRWNTKLLNSELLQGVLQGESAKEVAKRLENVFGKNERGWLTNARTAINSAQNRGRQNSYTKLDEDGVDVYKEWLASHDGKTRDSHKGPPFGVDGEVVRCDEHFSNGLEYPGDTEGDPEEVYNCRCTMIANIKGFKHKNYSRARIDRENKVAVGNEIFDVREDLEHFKDNEQEWKYEGIWKDPVTLEDYRDKELSVQSKIDYFERQMSRYPQGSDEYNKFRTLRDATLEFAANGKAYWEQKDTLEALMQKMRELDGGADPWTPFGPDAYSQARKDAANWFTRANGWKKAADKEFRAQAGEVWRNATEKQKDAIYEYTISYSKFNEPLRGIEYGTSKYLGVGNIKFDEIGEYKFGKGKVREQINAMTDIIDKSVLQKDTWYQRGCGMGGMEKFLQTTQSVLAGTEEELKKNLIGKTVTEYGFMSTTSAKGEGFGGDIVFNIYAPKGTKVMYVEPISYYGNGSGRSWDGKTSQDSFGHEFESIFQQGTEFRISKVTRESKYDTIYIDLEVIGQGKQQR